MNILDIAGKKKNKKKTAIPQEGKPFFSCIVFLQDSKHMRKVGKMNKGLYIQTCMACYCYRISASLEWICNEKTKVSRLSLMKCKSLQPMS